MMPTCSLVTFQVRQRPPSVTFLLTQCEGHGAGAVLWAAQRRNASMDRWVQGLFERRNAHVAAVAMANKNARIVWPLLAKAPQHHPQHVSEPVTA